MPSPTTTPGSTVTLPPGWLSDCMREGLQMLSVLALSGHPPADAIAATANVWAVALWNNGSDWQAARDRPRLKAAFVGLAGSCERWPAPVLLRQHLPPAPEPLKLGCTISEEQRRRNLQRLRALSEGLLKGWPA